jgi:CheY-like chemotaxis protein
MTPAAEAGKNAPLLVVDDDPDIREALRLLLEADGYPVITASDGLDAQEKIAGHLHPALILLDLMMPRMDGEQFLGQLRATHDSSVPVVIMSGHGVLSEGAAHYAVQGSLTKPIDLDDLLNTVHRFAQRPVH